MKYTWSVVGWIVCGALIVVLAYQIIAATTAHGWTLFGAWPPYVWGLLVLLFAWAFSTAISDSLNPFAAGVGDDGKLSLSKTQTLFWTYVVLYAFSAIYAKDAAWCATPGSVCPPPASAASAAPASPSPTPTPTPSPAASAAVVGATPLIPISFPESILLLLGFSVTSQIAAAGITRSQLASGTIRKAKSAKPDLSLRWLVLDDGGNVDLTRFQVVLWTVVAAGAFLSDTQLALGTLPFVTSLPDVGYALVLLMGVGQAAYVGAKLVVSPKATIYRIVPGHAAPGFGATISGSGFGDTQGASVVLIGGAPATTTAWSDSSIAFTVPRTQADGTAWPATATTVNVTVANGPLETAAIPFTVP